MEPARQWDSAKVLEIFRPVRTQTKHGGIGQVTLKIIGTDDRLPAFTCLLKIFGKAFPARGLLLAARREHRVASRVDEQDYGENKDSQRRSCHGTQKDGEIQVLAPAAA